ncbi:DUF6226 family protein [Arthrobacter oryzae]|uniref:DUF6226 family protein n=1 Tax=Arthrobacter oryzae TaxID=409290 RepID=UPI0037C012D2
MVGRLASRAKVETAADRMEMLVLAVAAGGISERYPVGSRRWSEYALTAVDGSGSESGRGETRPRRCCPPRGRGDPAARGRRRVAPPAAARPLSQDSSRAG